MTRTVWPHSDLGKVEIATIVLVIKIMGEAVIVTPLLGFDLSILGFIVEQLLSGAIAIGFSSIEIVVILSIPAVLIVIILFGLDHSVLSATCVVCAITATVAEIANQFVQIGRGRGRGRGVGGSITTATKS